jgi:hypothetical protein
VTIITDENLIEALTKAVGKKADYIMESCKLYHFYFKSTSFSYTKSSIINLLYKDVK